MDYNYVTYSATKRSGHDLDQPDLNMIHLQICQDAGARLWSRKTSHPRSLKAPYLRCLHLATNSVKGYHCLQYVPFDGRLGLEQRYLPPSISLMLSGAVRISCSESSQRAPRIWTRGPPTRKCKSETPLRAAPPPSSCFSVVSFSAGR